MAQVTFKHSMSWDREVREAFNKRGRPEINNYFIKKNRERSIVLRAEAGRLVQDSVGSKSRMPAMRKAQSTNYLARITAAEQNGVAQTYQYGIGRDAWLDKQTERYGRYWRSFEFGTDMFVGRQLVIVGKGARGTRDRSPEQDPGLRNVALMNIDRKKSIGRGKPAVIVKRPILAHDIYGQLAQRNAPRMRQQLLDDAKDYFRMIVKASSRSTVSGPGNYF